MDTVGQALIGDFFRLPRAFVDVIDEEAQDLAVEIRHVRQQQHAVAGVEDQITPLPVSMLFVGSRQVGDDLQ